MDARFEEQEKLTWAPFRKELGEAHGLAAEKNRAERPHFAEQDECFGSSGMRFAQNA